nr:8529_t:CDS:10 [Entrophospora candida]
MSSSRDNTESRDEIPLPFMRRPMPLLNMRFNTDNNGDSPRNTPTLREIKSIVSKITNNVDVQTDTLTRFSNFLANPDISLIEGWNYNLIIRKLATILTRRTPPPQLSDLSAYGTEIDIATLQAILGIADPDNSHIKRITIACKCMCNLTILLDNNAEQYIGNAVREVAIPNLCQLIKEPLSNDLDYLNDIIAALIQFSIPNRVDCIELILQTDIIRHLMENIFEFMSDNDRALPIWLMANCCRNSINLPKDSIDILRDLTINNDGFVAIFSNNEKDIVLHQASICITYMVIYDLEENLPKISLLFSQEHIIKPYISSFGIMSKEDQLIGFYLLTNIATKLPETMKEIFDNEISKAIFISIINKDVNEIIGGDGDQLSLSVMIEKIVKYIGENFCYYNHVDNFYSTIIGLLLNLFPEKISNPFGFNMVGIIDTTYYLELQTLTPENSTKSKTTAKDVVEEKNIFDVEPSPLITMEIDPPTASSYVEDTASILDTCSATTMDLVTEAQKLFAALILPILLRCFVNTSDIQLRIRLSILIYSFVKYTKPDILIEVLLKSDFSTKLSLMCSKEDPIQSNSEIPIMDNIEDCVKDWKPKDFKNYFKFTEKEGLLTKDMSKSVKIQRLLVYHKYYKKEENFSERDITKKMLENYDLEKRKTSKKFTSKNNFIREIGFRIFHHCMEFFSDDYPDLSTAFEEGFTFQEVEFTAH